MKLDILIVDDETSARRAGYKAFFEEVCKRLQGVDITPHFVEVPEMLAPMLGARTYAFALIDAVLTDNWGEDFSINWAVKQITSSSIYFAIVSKQWDAANTMQIDECLQLLECKAFMKWGEVENLDIYPIAQLGKALSERHGIDNGFPSTDDSSIFIVQLSDPQFGGFNKDNVKLETARIAEAILGCTISSPHFLAISGDITEHGTEQQFSDAEVWVHELCKRIGFPDKFPSRRIFLTPGNHDVTMQLVAAGRVSLSKGVDDTPKFGLSDSLIHSSLPDLALHYYRQFASKLSNHLMVGKDSWTETQFRHLGLVFYGVSTVQPDPFMWPKRRVDPKIVAEVWDNLNLETDQCEPLLRIGIGHHCPLSASGDKSIENDDAMGMLFNSANARTGLFLYGHVHQGEVKYQSDSFRLVTSQASTATKPAGSRPEDSLRGFTILEICRKSRKIDGLKAHIFEWNNNKITKNASKMKVFKLHHDGMFLEPPPT